MGNVIEYWKLKNYEDIISYLVIYSQEIKKFPSVPISVSKSIAKKLLEITPKSRSMRLASCFKNVLSQLPDYVIIKDIDVLFNPAYQVNILEILTEARKAKPYSLIWPGKYEHGVLIYSEEGYPDYKTFAVKNYDITCVI